MRYLLTTLLVLINCLSIYTQSYNRKIEWTKNSDNNNTFYSFTNKYQLSSDEYIYFESINIHAKTPTEVKFTALNTTQLEISGSNKISANDFKFQWEIKQSGKENFLQISITPTKNDFAGRLTALTEFKIDIIGDKNIRSNVRTIKQNSVIATGNWYKIAVQDENIYKIPYTKLVELGFNNPESISLFGSGGEQLSYYVESNINPTLQQIPIYVEKGSDNIFNNGDYILFYATGPNHWKYDSSKEFFWLNNHNYSKQSYYFLTETDSPLRITDKQISGSSNQTSNKYLAYKHHETNTKNIVESGRMWFGESFDIEISKAINFDFQNVITNSNSKIEVAFVTRSKSSSSFTIAIEDKTETITTPKTEFGNYQEGVYKKPFFNFTAKSSSQTVQLTYNKPLPSSIAWLDFITINNWCKTTYNNTPLIFQDPSVVGSGNITEYTIENCNSSLFAWEVTDIHNPRILDLNISGNKGTFVNSSDILQKHIVFTPSTITEPTFVGKIDNQNIQGSTATEFVIITTPELLNTAERLGMFHKQNENISYSIYTPEEIYTEFSSGSPDICAIRNFLAYLYNQPNSQFKYLLFIGDGSYNNKEDYISEHKLLPTYQSTESLISTKSFISDDFFGLLDLGEGESDGLLDIGIGRIPAENSSEADLVVNKMIKYYKNENPGPWQNKITSIADDDPDTNSFMADAEKLNLYINSNYPEILIQKIYLDSYIMEKSDIETYPLVNNAISNSIKQGTLIVNYVGHGSPDQLTHEYVITKEDIKSWNNTNLPVFVTATCNFSKWDNNHKSAGEEILFKENGGGIALFSTTRKVYSDSNYTLNYNFYTNLKKTESNGDYLRMGDIIKLTKVAMPGNNNKRNFTLLGDPLLKLQLPKNKINLNNIISNEKPNIDTLKAFDKITLKGNIDKSGVTDSNFNGIVYCTVYDKRTSEATLGNKGNTPFVFSSWKNILFQGKATVNNGLFDLSFIVPKDINYNYGDGKITLSAYSENSSAAGYSSPKIGGTGSNTIDDTEGPSIDLFMNNIDFTNGGLTNDAPKLIGLLSDQTGINTMNNSIGHEISITIDQKENSKTNISEFFTSETDTYQKGKVEFNLEKLENGAHTIDLKAWDIANNANSKSLDFIVANDSKLAIQHLLNYPNPFTEKTTFYFNHNRPYTFLEAIIQIYTPSGKLVKTLKTSFTSSSFKSEPIEWDGLDDFGNKIGRGVYIYQLKLRSNHNETINVIEKLVILK